MNKKIIGVLSVIAVLGGVVLLGTRTGGFGGLSSSAIGGPACSETDEARYTQSAEHIANLTEQIKKIQTNTKERQENKEKNRNDVEEIKKDIKTLQGTVKKMNEDTQKNCGEVTKKIQAGGRGGSIDNPAYGKCEDRKKEVQTAQTKIQTLQTTLKNKNEALEKIVDAQKEAQKSLRELEGKLKEHKEYRQAYEACKASLAGDGPVVPETGGDLPPTTPENNTNGTTTSTATSTATNGTTITSANTTTSTTGTDKIDDSDENTTVTSTLTTPDKDTSASDNTTSITSTNSPTGTNIVMGGPVINNVEEFKTEMGKLFQDYTASLSHDVGMKIGDFVIKFDNLEAQRIKLLETANTDANNLGAQLQTINMSINNYGKQSDDLNKRIKELQKNADDLRYNTYGKTLQQIKNINNRVKEIEKNAAELRKKVTTLNPIRSGLNKQKNELSKKYETAVKTRDALTISQIYNDGRAPLHQDRSIAQSMKYVVESYRTGTDTNSCPKTIKFESIDAILDSTVLANFNSGHNTLHRLTTAKPTPIIPNAADIYTTMQDILPEIEAGVSLYETQSKALKDAVDAPYHCFQWWKELGPKKQVLSVENIKANNIKLYIQNIKNYMLWMEQNNYIENN